MSRVNGRGLVRNSYRILGTLDKMTKNMTSISDYVTKEDIVTRQRVEPKNQQLGLRALA